MDFNNNNNNNNSSEITKLDFEWNENDYGVLLKIVNSKKVVSIQSNWYNKHIVGNFEFQKNSGIYCWELRVRVVNYVVLNVLIGVSKLSYVNIKNGLDARSRICGSSTNGRKFENDGQTNKKADYHGVTKGCYEMMVYVEFNTNTDEIKTEYYDLSGTILYVSDVSSTKRLTYPCVPVFILVENNDVEIIDFYLKS
eukprot:TRINITY_DN2298_c2_g1_i1.p1 TRINITY_DN2298_c2_g1~~TRINITY_DN2298_c2_g1_i1.p1  ORF type:complete len:196 (+),score=39.55 TRINITY_DN2298_c2_g1_i1:66-653(+)